MCGILGLYSNDKSEDNENLKQKTLHLSKILRHRGPDWNGLWQSDEKKIILAHERLSIVDINTGNQPLYSPDNSIVLVCNGEIYNHTQIRQKYNYNYLTKSDCEVIIPLYIKYGEKCVDYLDGIFSFLLYDKNNDVFLAGRDRIGVNPMYYGHAIEETGIWFASEFKAITHECKEDMALRDFPPGHTWSSKKFDGNDFDTGLIQYYDPSWSLGNVSTLKYNDLDEENTCKLIRDELINSVRKRLMCDVPFGVLLSGGLDSSLIASITSRYSKSILNNIWGTKLHTFSVGLTGSPDLKYAAEVSKFLNTIHHEFTFTIEDGLNAVRDVIFHTETYDITTIRASTPMYLMSRLIKANGIKMVLSGEGSDELFGGYLYFHQAPNSREFHKECCIKVRDLYKFDCLRANKSTMSWGVEARVPFLDSGFVDNIMNINPKYKFCEKDVVTGRNRIEKYILRKAFSKGNWLPEEVLWRQKEQFGDGVGYNWIDSIKEYANNNITDLELDNASVEFKYNTPETKEAYFYRKTYSEIYPNRDETVSEWIPQTGWGDVKKDPSGRVQTAHTIEESANLSNKKSITDALNNFTDESVVGAPDDTYVKKINIVKSDKINTSSIKIRKDDKSSDMVTHERCMGFMT
jgi:asparagine synthase (glutamine-hydrolysing)